MLKRLKNIEDNLVEVDDDDNKVGIFKIIKDIKDNGIKIDNNNEAIREIRECIKELIDNGAKVNNFNKIKEEIMEHIKNLTEQGINVRADEDQINDLINKISDIKNKDKKNTCIDSETDKFFSISYGKNKLSTEKINEPLKNLHNDVINLKEFAEDYTEFMDNLKKN